MLRGTFCLFEEIPKKKKKKKKGLIQQDFPLNLGRLIILESISKHVGIKGAMLYYQEKPTENDEAVYLLRTLLLYYT